MKVNIRQWFLLCVLIQYCSPAAIDQQSAALSVSRSQLLDAIEAVRSATTEEEFRTAEAALLVAIENDKLLSDPDLLAALAQERSARKTADSTSLEESTTEFSTEGMADDLVAAIEAIHQAQEEGTEIDLKRAEAALMAAIQGDGLVANPDLFDALDVKRPIRNIESKNFNMETSTWMSSDLIESDFTTANHEDVEITSSHNSFDISNMVNIKTSHMDLSEVMDKELVNTFTESIEENLETEQTTDIFQETLETTTFSSEVAETTNSFEVEKVDNISEESRTYYPVVEGTTNISSDESTTFRLDIIEDTDSLETAQFEESSETTNSQRFSEMATEASAMTTNPQGRSELTTEKHEASEMTTENHEASEMTTEKHEASEMTTEKHEASEMTTEEHEPSDMTTENHEVSEMIKSLEISEMIAEIQETTVDPIPGFEPSVILQEDTEITTIDPVVAREASEFQIFQEDLDINETEQETTASSMIETTQTDANEVNEDIFVSEVADINCSNEKRRFDPSGIITDPSSTEEAGSFKEYDYPESVASAPALAQDVWTPSFEQSYESEQSQSENELSEYSSDYLDEIQTAWEQAVIPELESHQSTEEIIDYVPVDVFTFPTKIQNVFDDYDEEARIASYLEINDAIAALNELSNSQIPVVNNSAENEEENLGSEDIVDVIRNFISEQDPLLELFLSVCFVHPNCVQLETPLPVSELGAEGRDILIQLQERRSESARISLLKKMDSVHLKIKQYMFQVIGEEVGRRGVSIPATKNIIDAVKAVWESVKKDLDYVVFSIHEIFSARVPTSTARRIGIAQIADILPRIPEHVLVQYKDAAEHGYSRYREYASWDSWKKSTRH